MASTPASVDAYLETLPDAARAAVKEIRAVVHDVRPGATERISYGIPTFDLDGRAAVHVAGWTAHVSIYPTPGSPAGLVAELASHSSGRGTTRFPLKGGIDLDLVRRRVQALAAERTR